MTLRPREKPPLDAQEVPATIEWTLQREIVVATPAALDLARAVVESAASEDAVEGRIAILAEIAAVLERETLKAMRSGVVDGLGLRHRRLWRATVEIAKDLLPCSDPRDGVAREPTSALWSRLAERPEDCLPGLPATVMLEVRVAARTLAIGGTTDSVELAIEHQDEPILRLHGFLQALTVIARRTDDLRDAAYPLARAMNELATLHAPGCAAEARRWATEREAERRFATNMKALEDARPALMSDHAEEWVIIADGVVKGFAPDLQVAAEEAFRLFPDGRALVMPVDERYELRQPDPQKWGLGGGEGED